jgi:fructokinase
MGVDINLVSEFGVDIAGNLINEFLKTNSVSTELCIRHPHHKTSLALAFLDSDKKASYTFYHDSPDKITEMVIPEFQQNDILLFGSFYAVKPNRRDFILKVLQKAVEARSVIYYDLNIRKAHQGELDTLMNSYLNNISVATIVKGSDEDFYTLFGLTDPIAIYEKLRLYCSILIITSGSKPMQVFLPAFHKTYNVPEIVPLSTIGAGDNFNAGFIYGIVTTSYSTNQLAGLLVNEIDRMAGSGLAFATETCMSAENYITGILEPDFWKKYI